MTVNDTTGAPDTSARGTGDGGEPPVPLLEDDGHRLGAAGRRGVTAFGYVPAPTRLSVRELAWLLQGARTGPRPGAPARPRVFPRGPQGGR